MATQDERLCCIALANSARLPYFEAMRIALAADHAGYLLKDELAVWLREQGHDVTDLGTNGPESVDYPQFGRKLAEAIASGDAEREHVRIVVLARQLRRQRVVDAGAAAVRIAVDRDRNADP